MRDDSRQGQDETADGVHEEPYEMKISAFTPEFEEIIRVYVEENPTDPLSFLYKESGVMVDALLAIKGVDLPLESIMNTFGMVMQHLLQVAGYMLAAGIAAIATEEEEQKWNDGRTGERWDSEAAESYVEKVAETLDDRLQEHAVPWLEHVAETLQANEEGKAQRYPEVNEP